MRKCLLLIISIGIVFFTTQSLAENMIIEDKLGIYTLEQIIEHSKENGININNSERDQLYIWLIKYVNQQYGSFTTLYEELIFDENKKDHFLEISLSRAKIIQHYAMWK